MQIPTSLCASFQFLWDSLEAITALTGSGCIWADFVKSCEVLTVTQLDESILGGCIRVQCLPYLVQDGTEIDLPATSAIMVELNATLLRGCFQFKWIANRS